MAMQSCSDHDFYPDNGTGAVGRARFARNRSSRPGWIAWSERRSSIPCPSRLGWASSDIVASKARDGSSSARRECGRESGLFEQHPGRKPLGADPILTMEISNLPKIVRVYTTLCR